MSESGCRQFDLFEGVDGSTLHLSEEWESEEALQEHYSKDYSVEVFENYKDWLSVPVEVLKMYQCSE